MLARVGRALAAAAQSLGCRCVIVLHAQAQASEAEIIDWCRDRMAGYKRPQSILFVADADMPRTATGKILHRVLRERIVAR